MSHLVYEKHVRVTGFDRATVRIDFAARYTNGESIRSLAESSGKSYGFVHRVLSEAGVRFRTRGGPNNRARRDAAQQDG